MTEFIHPIKLAILGKKDNGDTISLTLGFPKNVGGYVDSGQGSMVIEQRLAHDPTFTLDLPKEHQATTREKYKVCIGQDSGTGNMIFEEKEREKTVWDFTEEDIFLVLGQLTARIKTLESK